MLGLCAASPHQTCQRLNSQLYKTLRQPNLQDLRQTLDKWTKCLWAKCRWVRHRQANINSQYSSQSQTHLWHPLWHPLWPPPWPQIWPPPWHPHHLLSQRPHHRPPPLWHQIWPPPWPQIWPPLWPLKWRPLYHPSHQPYRKLVSYLRRKNYQVMHCSIRRCRSPLPSRPLCH